MKKLNIVVVILALLNTLESLSIDLYLPAFPCMADIFKTSIGHIQISISVFFAGFAIGQLVWGPLSDQKGRKPILLLGLLLFIGGTIAIYFTNSIYVLWAMRFLQAVGGSAGIVLGRAIVIDLYNKEKSVGIFSKQSQISGIAPIVAPLLGSILLRFWGWNSTFLFLFFLGILTLVLVIKYIPETNQPQNRQSEVQTNSLLKQLKVIISDTNFRNYTLIGSIAFSSLIIYISNAPYLFMTIHGYSSELFSTIFAFNSFALIIASYITPKLVKKYGDIYIMFGATCLLLLCCSVHFFVVAWSSSVWIEVGILFSSLMAIGVLFPITTANALSTFSEGRGSAAALMGFSQLMLTFLISGVIGVVEADSIMPMVYARILIALVAVSTAYLICKNKSHKFLILDQNRNA